MPQQFENPDNPAYHYRTTAVEIHEQLGRIPDAIVLGAGTGGTFTGVARYFKERDAARARRAGGAAGLGLGRRRPRDRTRSRASATRSGPARWTAR